MIFSVFFKLISALQRERYEQFNNKTNPISLQLLPGRIEDDRTLWILHSGSGSRIAEDPPETGRGTQAVGRFEEFTEEFTSFR